MFCGNHYTPNRNPILPLSLFGGDLSSLRELFLEAVHTELPWRNMVNLTWFLLANTSSVSMKQLLDFFESAPHLREIQLSFAAPTSGTQDGRLVSLACLKKIHIDGGPSSVLLDHLLIPIGAELTTQVNLPGLPIENHLPRSLDNLRNLSDFTTIQLSGRRPRPHIRFSGPNGQVEMVSEISKGRETRMLFESLAQFDTSKTERLEINRGSSPSSDRPHQALLPMKDLLVLTLTRCTSPHVFIHALDPSMGPPGVLVCPKLEEIVIQHREMFDIQSVIGTVAARASGGAKLKLVRIVSRDEFPESHVPELKKHVLHVECSREADGVKDGYFSDKEG